MASRRLTKVMRQAFVKAVMEDVPYPNEEVCNKEFNEILFRYMPAEVQAVYALDKSWLNETSHNFWGRGDAKTVYLRYRWYEWSNSSLPQEALDYIARIEERIEEYCTLKAKLEGIAEGARTLKELKTMLPEMEKYMPEDTPAPTKNLPVVSNLMAEVVKLGWPKGKIVNGIVTLPEEIAA